MYRGGRNDHPHDHPNGSGYGGYPPQDTRRRKRSFDDNDSYYNNGGGYKRSRYDDRGGYRQRGDDDRYGGRFDRNSHHSRYSSGGGAHGESDRARSWRLTKKIIVELGEATQLGDEFQGETLQDHLREAAAKVVTEIESDHDVKINHVATLVSRCVGRLAHKTSLYAVLVGLVNEKKSALGRKVLDATMMQLQKDMDFFNTERYADTQEQDDDDLRKQKDIPAVALRIRLLVRFLGELVSTAVLKADDLLSLLDTLQSVCTPDDFNTETDEPLRARENAAAFKDFFASLVLDTLLHCGESIAVNCEDMYESLLSRCKEYILNREEESNPRGSELDHPTNWLTRRLRLDLIWEPENEEEQAAFCKKCDPLSLHWEALNLIRSESATGDTDDAMGKAILRWKIPGVIYPQEYFANQFGTGEPHSIETLLSIDSSNFDYSKIPSYSAVFRILSEDSGAAGAAIANLHPASYAIIRGHFTSSFETFHPKPSIAAKHLLSMCRNFNVRFADASVKTEYILVETLLVAALGERDIIKLGYYCSLLYHLVKTDARAISPALAVVVELLFREIPFMNAGSIDAFVQLFSHFLSNFEYKWPWAHWAHVLEAQEDDAQRLFVSAVIERCVRLSYLQHMQSVLPSEFHMLLPPAPKPRIRFQTIEGDLEEQTNEDNTVSPVTRDFYQSVTTKLKAHPPAAALQNWLEEEIPTISIERSDAVEVVWTCILEAGAATFTHMRLLLEKYGKAEEFFGGEENELILVKTVGYVWLKSPQHISLILNMMLRQGIIHSKTIAKWVFTADAVQQYSWPYVWGILNDTLLFVQDTIAMKSQEIVKSKDASSASTENTEMTDIAELEDAQKRLQDDLKQILVLLFEGFNRVISEHKSNCDAEGVSYKDNWFMSALAQMKAIGSKLRVALENVLDDLHITVFNSNSADHDVKKVFHYLRDSYRS